MKGLKLGDKTNPGGHHILPLFLSLNYRPLLYQRTAKSDQHVPNNKLQIFLFTIKRPLIEIRSTAVCQATLGHVSPSAGSNIAAGDNFINTKGKLCVTSDYQHKIVKH